MNILAILRERIGAVIGAVVGSVVLLGCGLVFTLFLSPRQKLEAGRIDKMPEMDASAVAATASGEDVLFTGKLEGNPVLFDDFVTYVMDEWDVTMPDYDSEEPNPEPDGDWRTVERVVPDLKVNMDGQIVITLSANDAYQNGPLHEEIDAYVGYEEADYMGQSLGDGSLRYRGFFNGDLVTVWGKKAASEGVVPEELYAGDRVAFSESKHKAATGLLIGGICMMALSPVVLVGGLLAAIFGRRKR